MMLDAVYALAAENNRLYAARASGLFVSVDGGRHWSDLYESLHLDGLLPTTALAVRGDTLLAGVSGGVLHSVDAGGHWQFRRFPTPAPVISTLLMADGTLAGSVEDGVFYSPDGGTNWIPQNYGLLDACVLALATTPSGLVFAGTSSGVFRSSNGGRSWQQTDFPQANILSLASTAGGELLVGTEEAGLWRSTGGTNNWQGVGDETCGAPVSHIHRGKDSILASCGCRLLISQDAGRSWFIEKTFSEPVSAIALSNQDLLSASIWIALADEICVFSRTNHVFARSERD